MPENLPDAMNLVAISARLVPDVSPERRLRTERHGSASLEERARVLDHYLTDHVVIDAKFIEAEEHVPGYEVVTSGLCRNRLFHASHNFGVVGGIPNGESDHPLLWNPLLFSVSAVFQSFNYEWAKTLCVHSVSHFVGGALPSGLYHVRLMWSTTLVEIGLPSHYSGRAPSY